MANLDQYADTCELTTVGSNKTVVAEVLYHDPGRRLDVAVSRAVKLSLRHNGQCYEGKSAGMDFESPGPAKILPKPTGRVR